MISFTPLEPTFLSIGPLHFRYYGLMYVIAFFLAFIFINYARKKKRVSLSENDMWDLLFYGTLGVVFGGRIGYILFYNLSYFLKDPGKIFAVWEGGMSFHGGLIGVLVIGYIFCKKRKLDFFSLGDLAVIPLSLGIAFAKLGNFIIGELYGRPLEKTFSVPWGMHFEMARDNVLRHPSQLYEMSKNIIIFLVLIYLYKKHPKLKHGTLMAVFLLMYGIIRFFIEFVREPDLQIGLFFGWLSMGQILCFFMILFGFAILGKMYYCSSPKS